MNLVSLVVIFALAALGIVSGFVSTGPSSRSSMRVSMLFGGTKKKATKQATSITIENKGNKVIECGDKAVNLRKELTAAKIDVYPLASKVTGNCGGAGICGTCAVKVCKGMEFFNEPSKNEQNTLKQKKKPADQRLSCCSRISGPVTIKVKP